MIEQAGPTFPLTATDELYETAFRASVRGDHDLAIARAREAVRRATDEAYGWRALGTTLMWSIRTGSPEAPARTAESAAALRRAIRLAPDAGATIGAFAILLGFHRGRFRAAERLLVHADRVDPCRLTILSALCATRWALGDLDGAEEAARGVIRAAPTRQALALPRVLAAQGRYADAWDALREQLLWACDDVHGAPFWGAWPGTPEPRPRRDVLAVVEPWGMGDQILLARYVPLVARAGWRVRLHVRRPLGRLFRTLPGVDRLVVAGEPSPIRPPDAVLPFHALPYRFGTTLGTVPAPAQLRPDPDDVRRWRERLPGDNVVRVGMVWGSTDRHRSLRLADLAPLGAIEGVRFYGLQVGPHASQAASPPPGMAFEDLGGEVEDFADLAAAMVNLDAVVSVDTGPAHLAGSLGIKTWVLLPSCPDWFWGMSGDMTPWYPSVKLCRQRTLGDWSAPIAQVADALRRLAASRALEPANLGALPLVGLKGIDERGAYVSWLPKRGAAARS